MRVLLTRPAADSEALAAKIRARGHEPILAPLLTIEPSDLPPTDDIAGATLVFTSASGARAAQRLRIASPAIYAIGAATAEAARETGYAVAGTADGNVESLAALVASHTQPGARLYHVAGADIAGDLQGALAQRGIALKRYVAYRAIAAATLPAEAAAFFQGPAGAVLLFSPRTAQILVQLVNAAGPAPRTQRHRALALSEAVGSAARGLAWLSVEIAAAPEADALLALL